MSELVPPWMQQWVGIITPLLHVILIAIAAWTLQRFARRMASRLGDRYNVPREILVGARRLTGFIIYFAALMLILERLGVSGTVLWTGFTGFAAVGAVAFFAAWSVLSNIFCTMLIFATRLFRLNDYVEVLESGEKIGVRGKVLDINLIHTTLQEVTLNESRAGGLLQIPNNLFFQRIVRRWRGPSAPAHWMDPSDTPPAGEDGGTTRRDPPPSGGAVALGL